MAYKIRRSKKRRLVSPTESTRYWCPHDFLHGVKKISESLWSCNEHLSENVCSLIAKFVIGEKWPIHVMVKRPKIDPQGGYETITIQPNVTGSAFVRACFLKGMKQRGSTDLVLLNRSNGGVLQKDRSLMEQNVFDGTRFESSASFKHKILELY